MTIALLIWKGKHILLHPPTTPRILWSREEEQWLTLCSSMSQPHEPLLNIIPPGLEPGILRVLGARDNHYTTESSILTQPPPWLPLIIIESEQWRKFQGQLPLYIHNNWLTHALLAYLFLSSGYFRNISNSCKCLFTHVVNMEVWNKKLLKQ